MKPKIKLLFTVFLCSISSVLIAQPVDIITAKAIAENHLAATSRSSLKSTASKVKNFQFTSVKATVENNDTLYYILNDTINNGFVIVSADKRAWPILGYSTEGSFNEKKQPEAFTAWMENRKKEIESIKKNNLQPDGATVDAWQNLSLKSVAIETPAVEPLLKTKWDQGCYYNEMCPSDTRSVYCGHAPVGCVATAMAQIMKYWNYPTTGKSSNSYSLTDYESISADFGTTTYQWAQMPESLSGSNDAIAKLLYHCGVAGFTKYGPTSSSAYLMTESFVDFFDYSSSARLELRYRHSADEWIDLLKKELNLGHPILYAGLNAIDTHAFVCDGYQDVDYFHFNWGWGGANDGYYHMSNSENAANISICEKAILQLLPNDVPDGYKGLTLSANEVDLVRNSGQVNILSSVKWTANSDQPWISLNITNGEAGSSLMIFTAQENNTGNNRSATITITAEGFSGKEIKIKQDNKYNFEVSAGGLKQALGANLESITSMSIKGTIDARDFKTMRTLMHNLVEIDLSGAAIVAYTGTEGSSFDLGSVNYPANAIPEFAFADNHLKLTSIDFPSTLTEISRRAFYSSYNLLAVNLPNSLTTIGDEAFFGCHMFTTVNIPRSVISIGNSAFTTCDRMTSINVDQLNPNYASSSGVLYNKSQTNLMQCPMNKAGSFKIPATVLSVAPNAFEGCNKLTSISFPSSLKSIDRASFFSCSMLSSINIPSSVSTIATWAFGACSDLDSIIVNWPIPLDLQSLNSLDIFFDLDKTACTLYVPYGTASLYKLADKWKDFTNIVEMPGFKLSATTAFVKAAQGSTATIDISSNAAYTVNCDQTWLAVSPATGNGTSTLTFTAAENTGNTLRTATVTVSATGIESQTITVTQEAKNTTGIGQLSIEPEFILYPNPTTGKAKLVFRQIPTNGILITVNDINGKSCLKQLIHEKESWIDLSGNAPGIYFIKTDQKNLRAQKVILK